MIEAITLNTDILNIEEMSVNGEATELGADNLLCQVVRADLDAGQTVVYDEAVALFVACQYTNIINTLSNLTISRMTSTAIIVDTEDVDFNLLSEIDKDKLRALLALFVSLNEI